MVEPTRERIIKIAKPILFNTPMTRAILDDRKTATRRVIKGLPDGVYSFEQLSEDGIFEYRWGTRGQGMLFDNFDIIKAKYKVGDYLYVRETWGLGIQLAGGILYKADYTNRSAPLADGMKWRPSIHMPKEAARIFLLVTDVRVERLQEITRDDCFAEGVGATEFYSEAEHYAIGGCPLQGGSIERCAFIGLWNSTVKPTELPLYGWDPNPWVWVYEFERFERVE